MINTTSTPSNLSESALQGACVTWLWNTYPATRYLFFHVPNGGNRNAREGAQLKALGVIAGIPDCLLIFKGRVYPIEFKTEVGVLSPAQKVVHAAWQSHAPVTVVRTLQHFQQIIDGILKN